MIILQMNEVNFDLVRGYQEKGDLSSLSFLQDSNFQTVIAHSEKVYEQLEPWIQWVSFYTGKSYAEHKVFHLGDYAKVDNNDVFKSLADQGKKIGLFGCMNHPGTENLEVYIPDPWSAADSDNSFGSKAAKKVTNFLVNRNADMAGPFNVLWQILVMFFLTKGAKKFSVIIRAAFAFLKRDRAKLSGYFDFFFLMFSVSRHERGDLDLSSVFLNGVAHIQHHYMLSSSVVSGENPSWYVADGRDPLYDCLAIYDEMLRWLCLRNHEIAVITGLSQEPYPKPEIYWRFKDHETILSEILPFEFVCQPRMTRDFSIDFGSSNDAKKALEILTKAQVKTKDGSANAFGYLDLHGKNLFATFIYDGPTDNADLYVDDVHVSLQNMISFVAIKNASHISKSWVFLPSHVKIDALPKSPKIWDIGAILQTHLGK